MLSSASFLESSRRESRKRRRVSERRRVFSRLGVTSDADQAAATSLSDRRRSSNLNQDLPKAPRSDSPVSLNGLASGDSAKISMKIQFHIVVAPDNEPLILDGPINLPSSPPTVPAGGSTTGQLESQRQQQKRQFSNESTCTTIGEHIQERLSRQSSSTRRRQQLLAMHQQPALEPAAAVGTGTQNELHSQDNNNLRAHRSGSMSSGAMNGAEQRHASSATLATREPGLRSSTITGGMQDEATMNFLARHQQQRLRQASGSLTSNSAGSLVSQHQTLMASNANIRQRLEQREHIYFKRDGQRFGHEFTLKLAVDKSYRCLLKVRPLIPLQGISIQGHHVAFVDCSRTGSQQQLSLAGAASLTRLNLNANTTTGASAAAASNKFNLASRHQSIGGNVPLRNGSPGGRRQSGMSSGVAGTPPLPQRSQNASQNSNSFAQQALPHSADQIAIGANQTTGSSPSLSSLSLTGAQQQLLKQQQQSHMMRHFSATHCSSLSSSHLGSQLVYVFDWSAGRFEVNKNKARTQLQTVLKFKNGELLSLPLQVKFYEPKCKQHLSWGSQLHFIDYDCHINSMGQISVDKIQYY